MSASETRPCDCNWNMGEECPECKPEIKPQRQGEQPEWMKFDCPRCKAPAGQPCDTGFDEASCMDRVLLIAKPEESASEAQPLDKEEQAFQVEKALGKILGRNEAMREAKVEPQREEFCTNCGLSKHKDGICQFSDVDLVHDDSAQREEEAQLKIWIIQEWPGGIVDHVTLNTDEVTQMITNDITKTATMRELKVSKPSAVEIPEPLDGHEAWWKEKYPSSWEAPFIGVGNGLKEVSKQAWIAAVRWAGAARKDETR